MRESNFIEQNQEKWAEFESVLEDKVKDPDKLGDLFIQVTDDLSHARTFYPNRSVRVYLNGLAQQVFFSLYRSKPLRREQFFRFWTDELPRLIYESRAAFRVALLVFLLAMGVGVLSTYMEPSFPRIILGDEYVEMTLENIEKGDPMAVYKKDTPFSMMLGITGNNLMVTFVVFSMGVFFGIGTLGALLFNGVMVGAFQFFFIERGLFWDSFLTIWMHGSIEISAIVMAGAAGLVMGQGLVFPDTYSRAKAFQLSARRGIKVLLGVLPLILLAGFIESYLTRHTGIPNILRGIFILSCFGGLLAYYVWYPVHKARRGFFDNPAPEYPSPDTDATIDFTSIKTGGAMFADTVSYLGKRLGVSLGGPLLGSVAFCIWTLGITSVEPYYFDGEILQSVRVLPQFFEAYDVLLLQAALLTALTGVVLVPLAKLSGLLESSQSKTFWVGRGFQWFLLHLAMAWMFSYDNVWTSLGMLLVLPIVSLTAYTLLKPDTWLGSALFQSLELVGAQVGRMLGLSFGIAFAAMVLYLLLDSTVSMYLIQTLMENVALERASLDLLAAFIQSGMALFVMYLLVLAYLTGGVFLFHTLLEIKESPNLRAQIKNIQIQERLRGMLREK